ncbi:fizzy-related protein homolog, partial [Hippocampus zosterae]|uniref:fizzy-related protein homolog n=1 Tax=Hippocampus zosterae TaxID=109293 RepID=UPI00223D8C9C
GLKWSPDGAMIASGGNDNKLSVWSIRAGRNLVEFKEHQAAVKAIGWRSSELLASGGGAADQHIRMFSTQSLTQLQAVNTGSQVCNLLFSPISDQMVSTHGYALNEINVWNLEGENARLRRADTLTGHGHRVLYLAGSPDGSSIVTGTGDETLRFWKVFSQPSKTESNLESAHIELR